jgi:hypothetical protein
VEHIIKSFCVLGSNASIVCSTPNQRCTNLFHTTPPYCNAKGRYEDPKKQKLISQHLLRYYETLPMNDLLLGGATWVALLLHLKQGLYR